MDTAHCAQWLSCSSVLTLRMLVRKVQESILEVARVARHVEERLGPTVHRESCQDSGKAPV